eukprot:gene12333-16542_t
MSVDLKSNLENLRMIVRDMMQKSMYISAAFSAEQLTLMNGSTEFDIILYAKCFYCNNEPRRCLAVLEQRGLLLSIRIAQLCEYLLQYNNNCMDESIEIEHNIIIQQKNQSTCLAIQLAALCLYNVKEYDDCMMLLEPFTMLGPENNSHESMLLMIERMKSVFIVDNSVEVNEISSIYCTLGKCFDFVDNRGRAKKAFEMAIKIDIACLEALDCMINGNMIQNSDKESFFIELCENISSNRLWVLPFYKSALINENPVHSLAQSTANALTQISNREAITFLFSDSILKPDQQPLTASLLVRQAEYFFENHLLEECYRLSRHAYTIDPYLSQGLLIYIASMVELGLKTELFYLGHELVRSSPKSSISWYCVGCYYWCCNKLESAQKYLQKSTKTDKRFARAWIML